MVGKVEISMKEISSKLQHWWQWQHLDLHGKKETSYFSVYFLSIPVDPQIVR